jgi:hypothetical protein
MMMMTTDEQTWLWVEAREFASLATSEIDDMIRYDRCVYRCWKFPLFYADGLMARKTHAERMTLCAANMRVLYKARALELDRECIYQTC